MGVVGPNHGLTVRPPRIENGAEGLEHMGVAQIPALGRAIIHDPVVGFGITDQPGIGGRIQPVVAVFPGGQASLEKVGQHPDDRALTLGIALGHGHPPIGLGVSHPGLEAAVTFARHLRRFGIRLVQVVEDGGD